MTPFLSFSLTAYKVNDFFSHYWQIATIVILCLSCNAIFSQKIIRPVPENLLGESLSYDVKYSFIKVAEAELEIDSLIHYLNGSPHYLVSFEVRSVGLLKFFYSDLILQYETYISTENNSHSSLAIRKLKHGKKFSENREQFSYLDSLYISSYSVKRDGEKRFAFKNSDDNIRDVLGTYMWYRKKNMSTLKQSDTTFFFLAGKTNNLVVEPINEIEYQNSEYLKFNLLFPGVPDMPEENRHYVLVSKVTNTVTKVKASMDVGNFYFIRSD